LCLVLPFGPCNAVYSGRLGTHVVIIAIAMAIIINMVVGSGAVGGAVGGAEAVQGGRFGGHS